MGSLGHLRFLIDTSATTTSPLAQSWAVKAFDDGRKQLPRRVGIRETSVGLRAIAEGREDGDDGGDDSGSSSTLRESLRKSKKILRMQRDLLQQIEERRKFVSSIKDGVADIEQDVISYDTGGSLIMSTDLISKNSKFDATLNEGFLYDIAKLTQADSSETSSVDSGNFLDKEKETKSSSNIGDIVPDEIGVIHTTSLETAKRKITSDLKDGMLQDLTETNKDKESVEFDLATGEEQIDSPPLAGVNVMNVIVVAAECAPWSKTGGLGDVTGALPKALARRGHRVMVVAPRYEDYVEPKNTGVYKSFIVNGQSMEVTYFHTFIDGVDFVFIDHHVFHHRGNNIYGGDRLEILKRMVLLCKAAVEVPWHVPCGGVCYGDGNLAFVANDWHTALLPVYLKAYYRDNGLMKYARSTLVIHNIAHQGRGPLDDFFYVDLPDHYVDLFKLYDPLGGVHFNIFAAGLKTADRIVTVSHGYARELKTLEGGWGLHEIINKNAWKLQGIVNGIDMKEWNPELDVHLRSDGYANYSLETLEIGKARCKAALQQELGLRVWAHVPVISFIGRLDNQKGVDLIAEAIPWIVGQDVQLVMLGSGRPDLEAMLRRFESQHHDKVRGWVGFSVKMAHRITAGADILLMPSKFEPCGLNQLYAMRYGTVPVVHAVGGLRDTVQQFDPYKESGLGWAFDRAESGKLKDALGNCLNTYWNYKSSWKGLQKRGMMQDLSWDNAAQRYEEVLIAAKYQW